ncbi:MAG: arsenate reductase ArsC [Cenarchaeum sp. SB0665_bin_23]|nr:arsenate reductase ArsC [Cenarchaeum sp. SB0667_bin_13]MXY61718.1 arsenate reductase ArsC [Cenarchaeum sp. SB0665_bin_23]MXZ93068.1 arsenate reductase ArsC [Cenarchaeum sp. SB0666_bin_15]MYB46205.1 arsenate reductase ArsC [Cenarchaeum sp. SB0662_bin_33]MYC79231.1 arsenate reductase ArsC [Cenarchaeum sp. SB0661_bin_35]MYD58332.1 arsenate reductase ArsC [Cenarchaeum sp. SB0678_bin_8]MYG33495.1 arsenate reductase ArsC [Cenarchaeum sp. SB0677_bin_16]MYJ27662.1 arsenate reductase ArsC [Cenarch
MLFVCVENAGRSLMAEAFFKKYVPQKRVCSAGTQPAARPNNIVVEVMREVGIDIAKQRPRMLTNKMIEDSTCIVNMGCMDHESCPALLVDCTSNWGMPDPRGMDIKEVRKVRDMIECKVKEMITILQ